MLLLLFFLVAVDGAVVVIGDACGGDACGGGGVCGGIAAAAVVAAAVVAAAVVAVVAGGCFLLLFVCFALFC